VSLGRGHRKFTCSEDGNQLTSQDYSDAACTQTTRPAEHQRANVCARAVGSRGSNQVKCITKPKEEVEAPVPVVETAAFTDVVFVHYTDVNCSKEDKNMSEPLDKCVSLGRGHRKFTCSADGNQLTSQDYSDAECTQTSRPAEHMRANVCARAVGSRGSNQIKCITKPEGSAPAPTPATWRDCSGPDSIGKVQKVSFDPAQPAPNRNFTISASGTLSKEITKGTYSLVISYMGLPILNHNGDVCKNEVIQLPLGMGQIFAQGLRCPQAPGAISLSEVSVLKSTPGGAYVITLKSKDQDGKDALCLEVKYTE